MKQQQVLKLKRSNRNETANIAVLGAGGLGMAATKMLAKKKEMRLAAIADKTGYIIDPRGIDPALLETKKPGEIGISTNDAITHIIENSQEFDGIFLALPNLTNSFIPDIVSRFADAGYNGVMVDAMKRSQAVEMIFELDDVIQDAGITYITGAGATPGLLTCEGFNLKKAADMTCAEIKRELDNKKGILHLHDMEHADDVLLERAGIVSREKVTVGGVVDTRNPRKPVSTTMTLTGKTFDGAISSHKFILGDETTMAANVVGPALGWMKAGLEFHERGIYGVFGSAELMPRFVL